MDHAFTVIGENDAMALGRVVQNELPQATSSRFAERLEVFPGQPHDLLVSRTGDNPAFLHCSEPGITRHAARGDADLPEPLKKHPACGITADNPAGADATAEGADIVHHIGCPAEPKVIAADAQHWNRRLRRNSLAE